MAAGGACGRGGRRHEAAAVKTKSCELAPSNDVAWEKAAQSGRWVFANRAKRDGRIAGSFAPTCAADVPAMVRFARPILRRSVAGAADFDSCPNN